MKVIVSEFCPPLTKDHPARLEKLLNILNMDDAIRLYMVLPKGSLTSEDLSARSQLKPFILDFIEDAREILRMTAGEILDFLLEQLEKSSDMNKLEETLQTKLEQMLKSKSGLKSVTLQEVLKQIGNRFKLERAQVKKSKKELYKE